MDIIHPIRIQHQAAQQHQLQQHQQLPIDLTTPVASSSSAPSITLDHLSNIHAYRSHHHSGGSQHGGSQHNGHGGHQHQQSDIYDGSLLGSMLNQHHYHHFNGPSSPGSPINPNISPSTSVYGGHGGSGTMSPTKKLSKPLIEKRRRDRINRCLRLLKELVIDSKQFPVANVSF